MTTVIKNEILKDVRTIIHDYCEPTTVYDRRYTIEVFQLLEDIDNKTVTIAELPGRFAELANLPAIDKDDLPIFIESIRKKVSQTLLNTKDQDFPDGNFLTYVHENSGYIHPSVNTNAFLQALDMLDSKEEQEAAINHVRHLKHGLYRLITDEVDRAIPLIMSISSLYPWGKSHIVSRVLFNIRQPSSLIGVLNYLKKTDSKQELAIWMSTECNTGDLHNPNYVPKFHNLFTLTLLYAPQIIEELLNCFKDLETRSEFLLNANKSLNLVYQALELNLSTPMSQIMTAISILPKKEGLAAYWSHVLKYLCPSVEKSSTSNPLAFDRLNMMFDIILQLDNRIFAIDLLTMSVNNDKVPTLIDYIIRKFPALLPHLFDMVVSTEDPSARKRLLGNIAEVARLFTTPTQMLLGFVLNNTNNQEEWLQLITPTKWNILHIAVSQPSPSLARLIECLKEKIPEQLVPMLEGVTQKGYTPLMQSVATTPPAATANILKAMCIMTPAKREKVLYQIGCGHNALTLSEGTAVHRLMSSAFKGSYFVKAAASELSFFAASSEMAKKAEPLAIVHNAPLLQ